MIERWYYAVRAARDPLQALARRPRSDQGNRRAISAQAAGWLRTQYREHPSRSYQLHADNLAVRLANGQWAYPLLLGILDDHFRLGCYAQWYLVEGAEELAQGRSQAFQKRGLPSALMTDNGSVMIAAETRQVLECDVEAQRIAALRAGAEGGADGPRTLGRWTGGEGVRPVSPQARTRARGWTSGGGPGSETPRPGWRSARGHGSRAHWLRAGRRCRRAEAGS